MVISVAHLIRLSFVLVSSGSERSHSFTQQITTSPHRTEVTSRILRTLVCYDPHLPTRRALRFAGGTSHDVTSLVYVHSGLARPYLLHRTFGLFLELSLLTNTAHRRPLPAYGMIAILFLFSAAVDTVHMMGERSSVVTLPWLFSPLFSARSFTAAGTQASLFGENTCKFNALYFYGSCFRFNRWLLTKPLGPCTMHCCNLEETTSPCFGIVVESRMFLTILL